MRLENWPEILAEQIKAAEMRPFCWGKHDCCAFAATVVEAMTGRDWMVPPFAPYETEAEAREIIAEHAGLKGIATACLGEPIAPAFAQRGDVALIVIDGRDSLGICVDYRIAAASVRGLVHVPITEAVCAWYV